MTLAQTPEPALITGQIVASSNTTLPYDIKIFKDDIVSGERNPIVEYLDKDGKFSFEVSVPFLQELAIGYGFFPLLVAPGNKIEFHMTLDGEEATITFSGDNALLNQNIFDYKKAERQSKITEAFYQNLKEGEKSKDAKKIGRFYLDLITQHWKDSKGFLSNYIVENQIKDSTFIQWANYHIDYKTLTEWVQPIALLERSHEVLLYEDSEYMNFIQQFQLEEPNALMSSNYLFFLDQYGVISPDFRTQKKMLPNAQSIHVGTQDWIINHTEGISREIMLANQFSFLTSFEVGMKIIEERLDTFKKYVHHPYLRSTFLNRYQQIVEPSKEALSVIKKLEALPADIEGKDLIPNLLEKHPGKYLFIDFWGTSCGPCLAELPRYPQVMEQVDPNKIEFVFLASNSPEVVWSKIIQKNQLGGTHHLLSREQSSAMHKLFGFTGIPYHVLLDPEGNIVEQTIPGPGASLVKQLQALYD